MKLHLPVRLFLTVLAATVVPSYADTTLISEGINKDDVTKSERFYDTGKGHYFSWDMSYFWEDLDSLRKKNGSFSFLGDLYDRIPSNAKTLDYDSLTDDSNTCWAQVSMNLVEYWHSYYGVFCEDSRKLTYGLCYDKKYLDKTGGTLSLKQNLVFLDTFSNVGDDLRSYLDWMMLGYENTWYSKIEQSGNGGFWTDYFYVNSHNWGCDLLESVNVGSGSIKSLSSGLLRLLGFSLQDGSYVQTTKGQLVYVGMTGISGGGHAITCHGVELDARGQVMALYVTNSDDLEYKLFKLYIKERDGAIALYENEDCTELWEYAGTGWVIDSIQSIRTPEALKAKLERYESADNALVWTGNTACNGEWDLSAGYTSAYLPDETTGWHIKVVDDFYAAFYDAERIISFDDSAESGVVTVTNSGSAHRMELNNKELEYSFTGTGSNVLTVDTLVAAGGGKASFRKLQLTTEEAFINEHTVSIGSGATWRGQAQVEAKGRVELAGGILALTQLTLNEGSLSLTADSTIKSGNITVSGATSLVFSPATSGTAPLLTIGSAVSFSGSALDIAMGGDNLTLDSTYALIRFEKKDFEPGDLFTSEQGELSFADNILYLFYNPVPKLSWSTTSGTWSATQWGNSSTATDDLRAEFSGSDTQTVSISGTVSPHSIKVNNSGDITFTGSGNISGSAALTKNGSGSLTISTANSFTGGSTIKGGVVNFGSAQALGTGSITASDCTLNFNNANISNELNIAGNTVITNGQSYSGALVLENGELTGGSLRLSKDATVKSGGISNDLMGSAGMTKSGSGTVTLSGNNSFSGTTHIAEGTLVAGNAQALGSGKVSLTGGTLDMNNKALKNDVRASGVDVYITNGGNYSGALTLTGGKLTVEGGNMSCGSLTLGGGVILFDGRADGTTPQMSVDGVLSITAATEIGYTGAYSIGTHVLFSFDSLSGNIENLTLATPSGKLLEYTLYREGNMLLADIMACGSELEWSGKKGTWTIGGGNWNNGGLFGDGDRVTFSQAATVTIAGEVSPSLIAVNSDKSVTFKTSYKKKTATYSGAIIGNADLYKSGKGKLTMNDGNTD
ncbi:MAG: autotransporter-associated beta strand repeat-containing protein, partial [Akkermansia sp.]|nr:autotransporter-associated beta strand repeat-containing protein [Akkermansia sp.]